MAPASHDRQDDGHLALRDGCQPVGIAQGATEKQTQRASLFANWLYPVDIGAASARASSRNGRLCPEPEVRCRARTCASGYALLGFSGLPVPHDRRRMRRTSKAVHWYAREPKVSGYAACRVGARRRAKQGRYPSSAGRRVSQATQSEAEAHTQFAAVAGCLRIPDRAETCGSQHHLRIQLVTDADQRTRPVGGNRNGRGGIGRRRDRGVEAVTVRSWPPSSWFHATSANGCQSPKATDPGQPSWVTAELRVWSPKRSAVMPVLPVSVKPSMRICCSARPTRGPVVTGPR